MILNRDEYRSKLLGCWLGKNIGGTLGAPFEWRRQFNNVTFYAQELKGEPLPNDDLDIQLLWLLALEERGVDLDAHTLSEYWVMYLTPHWSEYGTAKVNMRSGLLPPLSGSVNNVYKHSCGAFIRSEIWACIAPGVPGVAVRYAYEDAILDHGDGEGTYAEIFCAAMESAAFVQKDIKKLIEIGLSYIPETCGVAGAVRSAVASYRSGRTWQEARDEILRHYRGSTFGNDPRRTSPDDHRKGFADGQLGWDAPSNVGMVLVGLLYGEGDFEKALCITVNCGEDTDSTGATTGSVMGIIGGIESIPERWKRPIGRSIKTVSLNIGDLSMGRALPQTIDEMTDRTERVARQVIMRYRLPVEIASDKTTDVSDVTEERLRATDGGASLYANLRGPVFRFDCFSVGVDYGDGPMIRSNSPKPINLTITNTYKAQANLAIRWYAPEGWQISPSPSGALFVDRAAGRRSSTIEFTLTAPQSILPMNRLVVEITVDGRPTVMLIPITLLSGNLVPSPRS